MFAKSDTLNSKKIVITGGPGTGKSSIINELKRRGMLCFEEISRQITLEARKNGIEQLFLTQPLLFSQLLLDGRTKQFEDADKYDSHIVFFDRGLPDVLAYMDYFGTPYPDSFVNTCKNNIYDVVFVVSPWEAIYKHDSERYETFEQSKIIYDHLLKTYKKFKYQLIPIPFDTVENRVDYILNSLNLH